LPSRSRDAYRYCPSDFGAGQSATIGYEGVDPSAPTQPAQDPLHGAVTGQREPGAPAEPSARVPSRLPVRGGTARAAAWERELKISVGIGVPLGTPATGGLGCRSCRWRATELTAGAHDRRTTPGSSVLGTTDLRAVSL